MCTSRKRFLGGLVAAVMLAAVGIAVPGPAGAQVRGDTIEWKPERSPSGPLLVVVGIAEQRAQVYRNGVRIGSTPVSTGKSGHETPTGLFTILEKKREHRSNLYNDAPMPNMQRLTWDGVALHAGRIPGYPASHGCVRLPHEVSDLLFDVTSRGSLVAIVDSFPETAVIDMTRVPTAGDGDPNKEAILPSAAAGTYGPVSVVVSTHDAALVVLRNGVEIGRADVDIEPGTSTGERLYVGRAGNLWEELPTTEAPLDPRSAAFAAGDLRVDPAFGQQLEALLVPGTTVLITDQPIGAPAMRESTMDSLLAAPIAGEFVGSVDAAP